MTAYPVDREVWIRTLAHATLSYALLALPLAVAATTAGPREPLFGGSLALVAPVYYLAAMGVAVAPALRSAWDGESPPAPDAGRVAELKSQYVDDDLTESELEERLERELDD